MIYWAQSMGMLHIPFGVHDELDYCIQPVSGIVTRRQEGSMTSDRSARDGGVRRYLNAYIRSRSIL